MIVVLPMSDDPTSLVYRADRGGRVSNADPIRITKLVFIIDANLCHDTFLISRRKRKIMIKELENRNKHGDLIRGTRKPFPQR